MLGPIGSSLGSQGGLDAMPHGLVAFMRKVAALLGSPMIVVKCLGGSFLTVRNVRGTIPKC